MLVEDHQTDKKFQAKGKFCLLVRSRERHRGMHFQWIKEHENDTVVLYIKRYTNTSRSLDLNQKKNYFIEIITLNL